MTTFRPMDELLNHIGFEFKLLFVVNEIYANLHHAKLNEVCGINKLIRKYFFNVYSVAGEAPECLKKVNRVFFLKIYLSLQ